MMIVLVLAAGSAIAALAVAAVQGQGVLSLKPVTPDFSRINPLSNARRVVGLGGLAELGKALFKLGIVGWAVWRVLSRAWPDLVDLGARGPLALLEAAQRHAVSLLGSAGAAFLGLALADWLYQKWQLTQSLKMTKEEVRQEMKQTDGDPTIKARMRQVARARIRRQMFADVKKADLVLVNPTHIAIAIKYDPMVAPAPIVLAMGERLIAERIKQLAYEHKVPVIQNKPLARALIRSARVGMMIPAELYAAVAEVLAFVLRQRRRRGAFAGSRA
ncbi:MAG: EscU/YscU/HrcU family type III secretion system export apparatus switch protein [Gemmatimonadetes bacterium]|nr:EscU/YscU/HrcU family type III secretion system export apparatus switch protein [Gemmatimonadota bacterium]